MFGPDTEEEWRWAEALAIEKLHGADAPRWIAERLGALGLAGDGAGVERFHQIAECFEQMLAAKRARVS
jgi:hypothetical protein